MLCKPTKEKTMDKISKIRFLCIAHSKSDRRMERNGIDTGNNSQEHTTSASAPTKRGIKYEFNTNQ